MLYTSTFTSLKIGDRLDLEEIINVAEACGFGTVQIPRDKKTMTGQGTVCHASNLTIFHHACFTRGPATGLLSKIELPTPPTRTVWAFWPGGSSTCLHSGLLPEAVMKSRTRELGADFVN